MTWNLKQKLVEQYSREEQKKPSGAGGRLEVALAFPNTYHVAMSNLGFQVMHGEINRHSGTRCDRFFYPDSMDLAEYERTQTPLMSLERQKILSYYAIVAFAVSFEMDYFHLLAMLQLGRVPIWAKERSEQDPLIIVGGPCATFNPEPLAEFVDAFVIGEGEEVIHEILDCYEAGRDQGLSREEILYELTKISGVYVPRFYEPIYREDGTLDGYRQLRSVPTRISRRWVRNLADFSAETTLVTRETEFKDMYLIEVARGCGRHCRFCMAGYCFRRPRVQTLANLKQAIERAKPYRTKVGLVGAAISDYPEIDELCEYILSQNMTLSVASLRADTLTPALAQALAKSGQRTITLAPEAGSERLRRVINKGITNDHLDRAIALASAAKIPHVRFYIMMALPFETDADMDAILELARNTKATLQAGGGRRRLTLSVNPFVPKPFTPFQWLPMTEQKVVEGRIKYLKQALRKERDIDMIVESPREAYVQAILARGDRRLSKALAGCVAERNFKGFRKALPRYDLDEKFYLYRRRELNEFLPWHLLDMGLADGYLEQELKRAETETATSPCREGCRRCGICKEGA